MSVVSESRRYESIMSGTFDALTEIFTLSKSTSREEVELAHRRGHERLGRDAAVLLGHRRGRASPRSRRCGSGCPRSFASRATSLMCSGLRMLPGLRRSACTPASIAAERELVLEVDVGDDRHAASAARSARGRSPLLPRCTCSGRCRSRPRPARRSARACRRRRRSWSSSSTAPTPGRRRPRPRNRPSTGGSLALGMRPG